MSQWFGNPERKPSKAPGGGSGSSSNSRGRPQPSRPQPSRPFRDPPAKPERFVSPPPIDEGEDDDWIDGVAEEPPPLPKAPPRPMAPRPGTQPPPPQRPRPQTQGQYAAGPGQHQGQLPNAAGPRPYQGQLPHASAPGPGASQTEAEADADAQPITRVEIGRRAVALIIDLLACYMASVCIMLIPFVNGFVNITFILTLFFLVRDFFFEGRGIGKNFMGLQVVDRATGLPPTLAQSAQRNIVLIAPCLVSQIIALALRLVPIPFVDHFVKEIVNIVSMAYVVIVLPLEAYRSYSRADGMRIGDEIAGTEIIESSMDFSKPVPRD